MMPAAKIGHLFPHRLCKPECCAVLELSFGVSDVILIYCLIIYFMCPEPMFLKFFSSNVDSGTVARPEKIVKVSKFCKSIKVAGKNLDYISK